MSTIIDRRTILTRAAYAAPAVALASVPAVAASVAHPDAELIALGERLRSNWDMLRAALARDCTDEEFDAISDEGLPIICEIEAIPATTIAGLKVKALAVAWLAGSETFADEDMKLAGENACPFDHMNASLFRDLRTIGEA